MIYLILLIILTVLDAFIDYKLIGKKKNVHTFNQYAIRAIGFTLLYLLFGSTWIDLLCSMMVYWFVFDTTLNVFRRNPLAYLSDRGIDKYQKPHIVFWIWKGILAIAAGAYMIEPEWFTI